MVFDLGSFHEGFQIPEISRKRAPELPGCHTTLKKLAGEMIQEQDSSAQLAQGLKI